ncbi:DUF4286 family protein [Arcticibacter sp.]|jgi:hypothetical protein|uniref:DUF4286 family protein n=1 Tax=Arcticibacter sp. TaxID=1872630 RepID=UPI00388E475D
MVLYNLTIIVDETINAEWQSWVKTAFIPKISETNLFISHRLLKVLNSPNEGVTYCLQFVAENAVKYETFASDHAPAIMELHAQKFGNQCVSFSSLMEYME